jgi:glycosyltransferase involved in cell wall biosynthesis
MRKVLYDVTYAARGSSGIPKDTRSVAEILQNIENVQVDFVISPRTFISRFSFSNHANSLWNSQITRAVLSRNEEPMIDSMKSGIQSLTFRRSTKLKKIDRLFRMRILKKIGFGENVSNSDSELFLIQKSYKARFFRPKLLGMFKINTKGREYYIQQHIDPISVHPKTRHLVRLHDILPLTHPFFFSSKGIKGYVSGITRLLSNHKIIWILDTQATAKEFSDFFGKHLRVEVIPCEVGYGLNPQDAFNIVKSKPANVNKIVFLCINTIEPRKNIAFVIGAFLTSINQNSETLNAELVIVGNYGWLESELIMKLRSGFYGDQIKFFEGLTDLEIQNHFKSADFVISASEAEGFGLPPLEGMLFGCLPIVSDIPQHRETMGDHAAYFQLNVASLTQQISKSFEILEPERKRLAIAAHDHVRNNYSREVLTKQWNDLFNKLT